MIKNNFAISSYYLIKLIIRLKTQLYLTGKWAIEAPEKDQLTGDYGLVLKSKAKHSAISVPLKKPFKFTENKPLIVQYEVQLHNGQECGGAYIKVNYFNHY